MENDSDKGELMDKLVNDTLVKINTQLRLIEYRLGEMARLISYIESKIDNLDFRFSPSSMVGLTNNWKKIKPSKKCGFGPSHQPQDGKTPNELFSELAKEMKLRDVREAIKGLEERISKLEAAK